MVKAGKLTLRTWEGDIRPLRKSGKSTAQWLKETVKTEGGSDRVDDYGSTST